MPLEPRVNSARFPRDSRDKRPGPGAYSPAALPPSRAVTIGRWRGLGTGWQYAPDLSLPGPGAYNVKPSFVSTKPVPLVDFSCESQSAPSPRPSPKLHASLFVRHPQMPTTAEFQGRVAAFYEAAAADRRRAQDARFPTFSEVKFRAEKEVLVLREKL
jgi:hypothetical protein